MLADCSDKSGTNSICHLAGKGKKISSWGDDSEAGGAPAIRRADAGLEGPLLALLRRNKGGERSPL